MFEVEWGFAVMKVEVNGDPLKVHDLEIMMDSAGPLPHLDRRYVIKNAPRIINDAPAVCGVGGSHGYISISNPLYGYTLFSIVLFSAK